MKDDMSAKNTQDKLKEGYPFTARQHRMRVSRKHRKQERNKSFKARRYAQRKGKR